MTMEVADRALLDSLFTAIDSKNIDGFLGYIADNGSFRFGSAPAVRGHDAIRGAVGAFFDSIAGLQHSLHMHARVGTTIICEGEVTYTRHNDTRITLPFVDVFEMEGSDIAAYKIYMDISPLYSVDA